MCCLGLRFGDGLLHSNRELKRNPGGKTRLISPVKCKGASLVAQMVKNLPAVQETHVQFLGWDDPLEKEMTTHPSILAWRIPWIVESWTQLSNYHSHSPMADSD